MTLEEIENVLKLVDTKIATIKDIIADYNVCNSQQSKTILLAAAGKLVAEFKPTTVR